MKKNPKDEVIEIQWDQIDLHGPSKDRLVRTIGTSKANEIVEIVSKWKSRQAAFLSLDYLSMIAELKPTKDPFKFKKFSKAMKSFLVAVENTGAARSIYLAGPLKQLKKAWSAEITHRVRCAFHGNEYKLRRVEGSPSSNEVARLVPDPRKKGRSVEVQRDFLIRGLVDTIQQHIFPRSRAKAIRSAQELLSLVGESLSSKELETIVSNAPSEIYLEPAPLELATERLKKDGIKIVSASSIAPVIPEKSTKYRK